MSTSTRERLVNLLNRIPVNVAIIVLCLIWLLPTLGLLITSFRPPKAVSETGWWTALDSTTPPADTYTTLCADCHGADFRAVETVNLLDEAWFTEWTNGQKLQLSVRRGHEEVPDMPAESLPPAFANTEQEPEASEVLDYLRYEAGLLNTKRFTLANYKDVMVNHTVAGVSYDEICAEEGSTRTRSCDFWEDATRNDAVFRALINSFIVTVPSTIIPILLAGFAAYAFSWLDFSGRKVLFAILVGLQIVPLQMTLVPIFRLYSDLGLNGTFVGVWLFHTGFGLPYAIYLMRNFIAALPRELMESAYLDGAGHFRVFWRIVLPLATPAIAALAIFQFLWIWNDLLVALIFLGNDAPVLTYRLSQMVATLGGGWYRMTAAAFVAMAVPLFIFLVFQRFFVRGMMSGSVKG